MATLSGMWFMEVPDEGLGVIHDASAVPKLQG
jgi:hypothetical protein